MANCFGIPSRIRASGWTRDFVAVGHAALLVAFPFPGVAVQFKQGAAFVS